MEDWSLPSAGLSGIVFTILHFLQLFFYLRCSVWFIKEKSWRMNLGFLASVSSSPTMLSPKPVCSTPVWRIRTIITPSAPTMKTSSLTSPSLPGKAGNLSPSLENLKTNGILDDCTLSNLMKTIFKSQRLFIEKIFLNVFFLLRIMSEALKHYTTLNIFHTNDKGRGVVALDQSVEISYAIWIK